MRTTPRRGGVRLAVLSALVGAILLGAASGPTPRQPHAGPISGADAGPTWSAGQEFGPVAASAVRAATAAATTRAVTGAGYSRMNGRLIGETPRGLSVWVNPHARHHGTIAAITAVAVAEQRRLGVPIRWRGYGTPRSTEGVVTVGEGSAGCVAGTNVVGMTWPYWTNLPNGDLYVQRAKVVLCPTLFSRFASWQWWATIRHELGHAVGLGHTNYVYRASTQVMNAVNHQGVSTYRVGDMNGLRAMAAGSIRVKKEQAPLGHFDGSRWRASNTITFTGWAVVRYYTGAGITFTLTDNGHVVRSTGPNVLRVDVNLRYDPSLRKHGFSISVPWRGGRHTFCVSAASHLSSVAVAKLGCVTWQS